MQFSTCKMLWSQFKTKSEIAKSTHFCSGTCTTPTSQRCNRRIMTRTQSSLTSIWVTANKTQLASKSNRRQVLRREATTPTGKMAGNTQRWNTHNLHHKFNNSTKLIRVLLRKSTKPWSKTYISTSVSPHWSSTIMLVASETVMRCWDDSKENWLRKRNLPLSST